MEHLCGLIVESTFVANFLQTIRIAPISYNDYNFIESKVLCHTIFKVLSVCTHKRQPIQTQSENTSEKKP